MRRLPVLRAPGPSRSRRSTTKHRKLYSSQRWRKASEEFRASPEGALCIDCKARGLIVPSAITDHIVPHRGNLELFWDPTNWAPRCWSCHSAKSAAERSGRPRRKGCDASGMPLDPDHWWRTGS